MFCYIGDPEYNEGLIPESPQMGDEMSVENPEAKISQTPAQAPGQSTASSDTASNTESDSEDMESNMESDIETDAQVNFQTHRAGTVKKPTQENDQINNNDHIIISPFAVCGGHRVGSLRQLFNPLKDNNKKKTIRRATAGSLDAFDSRPGSLQKADPALKVRIPNQMKGIQILFNLINS